MLSAQPSRDPPILPFALAGGLLLLLPLALLGAAPAADTADTEPFGMTAVGAAGLALAALGLWWKIRDRARVAELEAANAALRREVEERRRADEEGRRIAQKLAETQRLESLSVLAGGIAHDFNNLLAAILGNAELLRLDLPPGSSARENVDEIVAVTRRAAGLVEQMLACAGKVQGLRRPLQLNALLRAMERLLHASAGKHARVHVELAEALPAVLADPAQVQQIVMNLVMNASEALSPAKGGAIRISTAADDLDRALLERLAPGDERAPGRYVRLTVVDTGCGMDSETLSRIFDPFFTTRFIGRGLGLAAVHGIVRSHGGVLAVESERGRGTAFRVWLPAAEVGARPLTGRDAPFTEPRA